MGWKNNSVVSFSSKTDVGIDRVPLGSIIQVQYDGRPRVFTLNSKASLTNTTTIEQAYGLSNLSEVGSSSGAYIITPSILTPIQDATGVELGSGLTSSTFSVSEGIIDTHASTDWEVASDVDFNDIVFSAYNSANLTSISTTGLQASTEYFVRVRYRSTKFISLYSAIVSYTTVDKSIETPVVTLTDGTTDVQGSFAVTSSAFTVINGTDTHVSSTWEIKTSDGLTTIWSSIADTSNLTSITVPNGYVQVGTSYLMNVTYNGAELVSSAGSTAFTTAASFTAAPILTGVSSANELTNIDITISNYDAGATYTITVGIGSFVRNSGVITWTLPDVVSTGNYIITCKATKNGADSPVTSKTVSIVNVPIEADAAASIVDYLVIEDTNDGFSHY